ncbi:MAG: hypothetical protein WAW61_22275 [Methylococcaceae bacterium]
MNAQSVLADKSGFMIHAETKPEQPKQLSIFSFTDIKNLSDQDVLYRIDSITQQSELIRWRLWAGLRDRYPSTNAWGAFLEEARNRHDRADCVIDVRDVYRCVLAGKFCERHKIGDLNKAGIKKTVIYLLSQKGNAAVSDRIFQEIRRRNVSIETVQRMIEDAKREIEQDKAVLTIDKQPEAQTPELMEYDRPVEPYTPIIERVVIAEPVEDLDPITSQLRSVDLKLETLRHEVTLDNEAREMRASVNRRMDLILELSHENAAYLTEQQQKDEIKELVKSYQLGFLKEAGLLQACAKEIAAKGYGK